MARVVQRRTGPPYLLIIFVFLFLIAATVAVIQYTKADELSNEIREAGSTREKLATDEELNSSRIIEMMRRAETTESTVIRQLTDRIEKLAGYITTDATFASATQEVEQLKAEVPEQSLRVLPEEVRTLRDRIQQLKDQDLARLEREKSELQAQLQATRNTVNELEGKLAGLREDLEAARGEREAAVEEVRTRLQEQLETAEKRHEETLKEKDATIALKTSQLEELQGEKQDLEARRIKLESVVQDQKKRIVMLETKLVQKLAGRVEGEEEGAPEIEGETAVKLGYEPDGKVLKFVEDEELVYINIGARDDVRVGQTFAVYAAQEGIPESGRGKANIVVVSVSPNVAACRLVRKYQGAQPVLSGDLVANIAYDESLTYTFVVKGRFDLYGQAQPGSLGAQQVKAIIERSGGQVVQEIDVQTDFAVLGTEPPRPSKPNPDAEPTVWEAYRQRMETWQQYQDVKAAAINSGVQILNTNRFLAFMGYTPEETLETTP